MQFIRNPELIKSKMDFYAFLNELQTELMTNPTWQQDNALPIFLEMLTKAVCDSDILFKVQGLSAFPETHWAFFAHLLSSATVYD